MKKILTVLLMAALLAMSSYAQPTPSYKLAPAITYTSVAAGVSNYIGASGINFIDCSKQQNIGISIASVGASASTAGIGFSFTPTIDGTTNTMLTNLTSTITNFLNGTTIVYWGTNLNAVGYKGFLVTSYTNGAALNVTNTLTYANKIGAP
jgi:hypothetical protein